MQNIASHAFSLVLSFTIVVLGIKLAPVLGPTAEAAIVAPAEATLDRARLRLGLRLEEPQN